MTNLTKVYLTVVILITSTYVSAQTKTVINGVVTDLYGMPISEARVVLISDDRKIQTVTNTDREGKYHFRLDSTEPLKLIISVNSPGFLKEERKIESRHDDQLVIDFGLRLGRLVDPPTSHTQVTVRKSTGEPVKEAKVTIYCPFNEKVFFTGKTDKNGIYNLDITEGGQFIVYVFSPGFYVDATSIYVPSSQRYEAVKVSFNLKPINKSN